MSHVSKHKKVYPSSSHVKFASISALDKYLRGRHVYGFRLDMIDHILGRPSQRLKSVQVLLVVLAWTTYLLRGNRHGPFLVRRISRRMSNRLTTWQTFCMTMTGLYLLKNADKLLGLG